VRQWREAPSPLAVFGKCGNLDLLVAVDAAAEPDTPSAETLARLRAHYREDEARLRDFLDAPPPWAT